MTQKLTVTKDAPQESIDFAQVGRPHGLRGAFFLKTEDNRTEWPGYKTLLHQAQTGALTIWHVEEHYLSSNKLAIRVAEVKDRTEVEKLYDTKLSIPRQEILLQPDEYLAKDLWGCQVFTQEGMHLGNVIGVLNYGAQENLEIQLTQGNRTIIYPFLERFVLEVDLGNKKIIVTLIPELLEDSMS